MSKSSRWFSNVGALASNLGVVELTVALQYLLNTPEDKIVWDTSNQAYTHKLLTGRGEQFHPAPVRRIERFCKREESAYDTFNAGHAGTGVPPPSAWWKHGSSG